MQLKSDTASDMEVRNIFDPEQNINGGTRYLRFLLDRYNGDLKLTLAAYNAGLARVDECLCIPKFKETRKYVPKVLGYYDQYAKQQFPGYQPKPVTVEPKEKYQVATARHQGLSAIISNLFD